MSHLSNSLYKRSGKSILVAMSCSLLVRERGGIQIVPDVLTPGSCFLLWACSAGRSVLSLANSIIAPFCELKCSI